MPRRIEYSLRFFNERAATHIVRSNFDDFRNMYEKVIRDRYSDFIRLSNNTVYISDDPAKRSDIYYCLPDNVLQNMDSLRPKLYNTSTFIRIHTFR